MRCQRDEKCIQHVPHGILIVCYCLLYPVLLPIIFYFLLHAIQFCTSQCVFAHVPAHVPAHTSPTAHSQVMHTAKQRQTTTAKAQAGERLGGRAKVALISDRHHLDFLPLVLEHYGRALCCGCAHVYQALPRLLTLWFQAGTAAAARGQRPSKKVQTV